MADHGLAANRDDRPADLARAVGQQGGAAFDGRDPDEPVEVEPGLHLKRDDAFGACVRPLRRRLFAQPALGARRRRRRGSGRGCDAEDQQGDAARHGELPIGQWLKQG